MTQKKRFPAAAILMILTVLLFALFFYYQAAAHTYLDEEYGLNLEQSTEPNVNMVIMLGCIFPVIALFKNRNGVYGAVAFGIFMIAVLSAYGLSLGSLELFAQEDIRYDIRYVFPLLLRCAYWLLMLAGGVLTFVFAIRGAARRATAGKCWWLVAALCGLALCFGLMSCCINFVYGIDFIVSDAYGGTSWADVLYFYQAFTPVFRGFNLFMLSLSTAFAALRIRKNAKAYAFEKPRDAEGGFYAE